MKRILKREYTAEFREQAVAMVNNGRSVPEVAGDMKGMEMKGMDQKPMSKQSNGQSTHKAIGVVKKVDPKEGTVSLAHEAIKSLNWPAMTMSFKVQDKAVLDKLAEGKKVEFEQKGKDYVITSVK